MNRTILIVICDFLLVSLLAFSTVDINKVADTAATRGMRSDLAQPADTNRVGGRQDLGDVMRLALDEEKKTQDALNAELSKTKLTANQQAALLNQRNEQLQAVQQQLQTREQQAQHLQETEASLNRQMAAAESNVTALSQQLHASTLENLVTKEERAKQEAEIKKQMEKAAQLQQQLSSLEKSNQLINSQRDQLANKLQLTEVEKAAATTQLARTEQDLNFQREQNSKLTEGVTVLATKSSELAKELRENQQLAPNTIFNEFVTNRLNISFYGVRPGVFASDTSKYKQTQSIMVTDGTNTFAVCHLQDTLLTLWDPGTPWMEMTGTLARNSTVAPVTALYFYRADPRVALMPVPASTVGQLGCKVYNMAADPFKFQDAVVVGAREGYYGQCQFQMDLSAPQYLRMDRNSLRGLFGKFNPSTGDLVFSKTGDLLGVMVNNTYCVLVRNFEASAIYHFGTNAPNPQPIASTLSSLYATVAAMPFKLQ